MSEGLGLLPQFKAQLQAFVQEREQIKVKFEQLQGAIFAIEQVVLKIEAEARVHLEELAKKTEGEQADGQTNEQDEGQAA